ncbi:MAG: DUF6485 family protein [Promethearchaeota archaeon]
MIECNYEKLNKSCPCTYTSCSRKGKCCECIEYHLKMEQLPGCVFAHISRDAERTYNRDFEYFAKLFLDR